MTEDDVRDYFKKFGDLDHVNVVKDRETKESKGIAYVKFLRFVVINFHLKTLYFF